MVYNFTCGLWTWWDFKAEDVLVFFLQGFLRSVLHLVILNIRVLAKVESTITVVAKTHWPSFLFSKQRSFFHVKFNALSLFNTVCQLDIIVWNLGGRDLIDVDLRLRFALHWDSKAVALLHKCWFLVEKGGGVIFRVFVYPITVSIRYWLVWFALRRLLIWELLFLFSFLLVFILLDSFLDDFGLDFLLLVSLLVESAESRS